MKNDITYEYRVFTNRLVDVESMEVGRCTSKSIKELKAKDKISGRFFHTSDTDEWYFCWNGELQKLNLKGDSDVNAALEEVKTLIANANAAVDEVKETAKDAKDAADKAQAAADAAGEVVDSIENKADKSEVENVNVIATAAQTTADEAKGVANDAVNMATEAKAAVYSKVDKSEFEKVAEAVEAKAEQSDVDAISNVVETKADKSVVDELAANVALKSDLDDYALKSEIPTIPSLDGFASKESVDVLTERVNAFPSVNDIALKSDIPSVDGLATEAFVMSEIEKAQLEGGDVDLSGYATKTWVGEQGFLTEHQDITGKQDVIADLDDIRSKANSAIQEIPAEYVTDDELTARGYLTEHQSLDNYYTKKEIDDMIKGINDLIGEATNITNTILA